MTTTNAPASLHRSATQTRTAGCTELDQAPEPSSGSAFGLDQIGETTTLAVSYLRVSTKEQASKGGRDEGFSIPAQREANAAESAAETTPEPSSDWDESENGPDWSSENEIPDNIPDDLPVDTAWDDIYQSAPAPAARNDDENDHDFETRNSPTETLQDHLEWQLNLTPLSERDQAIAHALMDAVDERADAEARAAIWARCRTRATAIWWTL